LPPSALGPTAIGAQLAVLTLFGALACFSSSSNATIRREELAHLRLRSCDSSTPRLGRYCSHRSGWARNGRRRGYVHSRPVFCYTTHWLLIRSRCCRGGFPSSQPRTPIGGMLHPNMSNYGAASALSKMVAPVPSGRWLRPAMLDAPCVFWPADCAPCLALLAPPDR